MDETQNDASAPQQAAFEAADEQPAGESDSHRGFVREMNSAFATVYGVGGVGVIATTLAVVLAAYQFGQLGSPLVWIAAVVVFLVSLFVLRIIVRRRALGLLEKIGQYCQVNDLTVDQLRERYASDKLYPYFASIFEVIERRDRLRNQ